MIQMLSSKHIVITEYERLYLDKDVNSGDKLSKKQFLAIEDFVLSNELPDSDNYLKLGQSGNKKFLQAQNYIGVIQLKDGLTIEILPKIAKLNKNPNQHEVTRQIVIKMLKTLRNSPFKETKTVNLKVQKMPLLEIFISMFMQGVSQLIKKGIKNDYIESEENLPLVKGKLLFSQQIKYNLVHKERFYVSYDNYLPDRIENRLIKTTLQYLYSLTKSNRNQQAIREALFIFADIASVHDVKTAFSQVKINRQMQDYEQLITWCRLFLLGNSFTPHKGNNLAFSLLFDMNKLFESYVGQFIKKHYQGEVSIQDNRHYLAERNNHPCFALRPDIVINQGEIVADTKWKLLTSNQINNGITQADIYQIYAYATKYQKYGNECRQVELIYPATEDCVKLITNYQFINFLGEANKSIPLKIKFFDLTEDRFINGGIFN